MSTIRELQEKAHANAVAKGFTESTAIEALALIGCEAAEAIEEIRSGLHAAQVRYEITSADGFTVRVDEKPSCVDGKRWNAKPCGVPSELADIVIRTLDFAGRFGIDLEAAIEEKMAYNATRPFKHGKVL